MTTTIRVDERWRREMAPTNRLVVALITFPLALRYGYRTLEGLMPTAIQGFQAPTRT